MVASNWSTTLILYLGKNNSTNYTTHCLFDVNFFLRYAGTAVVALGFLGNILSMIVFSRKTLRSRSCSIYFLALSLSDVCVLLGYTFENLLFHAYGIQVLSNSFMCKSVIFLIYASTDVSNYLLTFAAIDRCVLVSQRTSVHHRFCRKSVATSLILLIIFLFSVMNSHFLFGFHVDEQGACLPAGSSYIYFYVHHYDSYIDILKTVLIPFFVIFLCNILIIFRLTQKQTSISRTASITRRSRRRRIEKDRQLTGFLLSTSILFILLSLPSEINDFLRTNLSRQFQISHACEIWTSTTIFILLHQINHASHFYVYTLTGPIFRKEFQKFLCLIRHPRTRDESCDYSKRQSITSRYTHHDDGDDRRASLFLRQTQRPSVKFEI